MGKNFIHNLTKTSDESVKHYEMDMWVGGKQWD